MEFENFSKQVYIDKPKPTFTFGIPWNSLVALTECCKFLRRRLLKALRAQPECDQSEIEYLLEYCSLVCKRKTSHIATTAFVDVTGAHPTRLIDLFKMYVEEARPVEKNHA